MSLAGSLGYLSLLPRYAIAFSHLHDLDADAGVCAPGPALQTCIATSDHDQSLHLSVYLFVELFAIVRGHLPIMLASSLLDRIFGRQQEEQFDPAGKPSALCQAQQALVHGAPTMSVEPPLCHHDGKPG